MNKSFKIDSDVSLYIYDSLYGINYDLFISFTSLGKSLVGREAEKLLTDSLDIPSRVTEMFIGMVQKERLRLDGKNKNRFLGYRSF